MDDNTLYRIYSLIKSSELFQPHDAIYWLGLVLVFLIGLGLGLIIRAISKKRLQTKIDRLETRTQLEYEQQTVEYVKNEQTERFARMVNELSRDALIANF